MAVARPPQYGYKPKKPRLRTVAVKGVGRGGGNPLIALKGRGRGSVPGQVRRTAAPSPTYTATTPQATPTEVSPTTQAVPNPAAAVAPPATPQASADRISADEQYNTGMGDINYQLREAAQQYGGSPQVLQFGYGGQDPNHPGVFLDSSSQLGVNTNDPNSALAVIQRNQEAQQRAQNENSNQHNTFFSGLNLKGQQMILDEQDRQRAQAYQDYMDAVHRLTTALEGLRGSRNESYRNANAADLTTAAALPPEAQSDDAGTAPPTAPAVPATPTTPTKAPIPQGSSHKTLYVKSKKKKARRKK